MDEWGCSRMCFVEKRLSHRSHHTSRNVYLNLNRNSSVLAQGTTTTKTTAMMMIKLSGQNIAGPENSWKGIEVDKRWPCEWTDKLFLRLVRSSVCEWVGGVPCVCWPCSYLCMDVSRRARNVDDEISAPHSRMCICVLTYIAAAYHAYDVISDWIQTRTSNPIVWYSCFIQK